MLSSFLQRISAYNYLIYKSGSTIIAEDERGGVISAGTDAATVIQAAIDEVDDNSGGHVHIKGYGTANPYNITTAITLPDSGHLTLTGDGPEYTYLKIPTGSDNNMFNFTGVKTANAFFNTFANFGMEGNTTDGTNNTGFKLDATSFGITDTLWFNLFILRFKKDCIFIDSDNKWNNQMDHCVIEHAGRAGLYDNGTAAQDFKVTNSKFLFNDQYGIFLEGDLGTYIGNWFYQNDQHAFWLEDTAAFNTIVGNRFAYSSFGTDNTYDDLHLNQADSNAIVGNIFAGSTGAANKARYGVYIDSFSTTNIVHSNIFAPSASFGTGQLFFSTTSNTSTVRNNTNFVTENSGTATVANGATTAAVTHGLSYTPSLNDISVTPTNSMGNATKYSISSPTSTQFTITVDADPGATTATFVWNVRRTT